MPTFNSSTYAAQIDGNPRNRVDASIVSAEKRIAEVPYAFVGTEASGDTLKLWQIPPGVVLYAEEIQVVSEGIGGTSVTFTKLGDQATDNRYSTTAVALTAAGIVNLTAVQAIVVNRPVIDSTNNVLQGTLGGTLPATAGKKIVLKIPYRLA